MKECLQCDRVLPIEAYHHDRTAKDGRNHYCRECVRENWIRAEKKRKDDREVTLHPLAKHWISRPLIQRTPV